MRMELTRNLLKPGLSLPALSQHQLSIPIFLANSLALSVIMTWLYRRTRGDLLLMILVHVAAKLLWGRLHER